MNDARALTVRQPWAALIAAGLKPVENRTWALPKSFTGPLLIHAGTKDDRDGWAVPGVREALAGRELIYGALVAVAGQVSCHPGDGCCSDGWGEHGAWHWALEDVAALPEPVSASGRLGLWRPEPEAVVAALAHSQGLG